MNVHWKSEMANPPSAIKKKLAPDPVGRFGLLAILVSAAMLIGATYAEETKTYDKCFSNFYLADCAR